MLLYLHGFRSSPASFKARMLADRMRLLNRADEFACPQLPVSPGQAIALIESRYRPSATDTIVGSSLGGFYATWLAQQFGSRAVLINPAVDPARDLAAYVGPLHTYHDHQPMHFHREYLDELRALDAGPISDPQRYLLLAAKGDEVLDWREMVQRYGPVNTILIEGGDHGLSDFGDYIERVLDFASYGAAER